MMPQGRLTDMKEIDNFVFAGNATFTVKNVKTGGRHTYKVRRYKDDDPDVQVVAPYFVSYLVGSDNTRDYAYMGTVFVSDLTRLAPTRATKLRTDSAPWLAFSWLLRRLANAREGIRDVVPDEFQFWHEGKCAKCGRALTDPTSIERGYGPLCYRETEYGVDYA